MDMTKEDPGVFCPVCKMKNSPSALICVHCGSTLDLASSGPKTTVRIGGQTEALSDIPEEFLKDSFIPAEGMAIYVIGIAKPIAHRLDQEFIIGRKVEETPEPLVDLSALGGFEMGVSRRHVRIRAVGAGYEAVDLNSTNGTWIHDQRLLPEKPYPLPSGSQLRIGRMGFLILYRPRPDAIRQA